jgi:hypothetical protein
MAEARLNPPERQRFTAFGRDTERCYWCRVTCRVAGRGAICEHGLVVKPLLENRPMRSMPDFRTVHRNRLGVVDDSQI